MVYEPMQGGAVAISFFEQKRHIKGINSLHHPHINGEKIGAVISGYWACKGDGIMIVAYGGWMGNG